MYPVKSYQMEALDKKYLSELEEIKTKIQASAHLEKYLDEEEDDDYKTLVAEIEPEIQELYLRVANDNPLQLESFEKVLLDDEYEGLYIPKVVGYSVLRGAVDSNTKYRQPQDHFREILVDIANSANFEMIKQRIGQSVQVGFALSSDIWITNLVESINNKRVRSFLESQKSDHLRVPANRALVFKKYQKQFESLNFLSTDFPKTTGELKSNYHSLRAFLLYRIRGEYNNESLHKHLLTFISNDAISNHDEYLETMMIIGMYYGLNVAEQKEYSKQLAKLNGDATALKNAFFEKLSAFRKEGILVTAESDMCMAKLVHAAKVGGNLEEYYTLMELLHSNGYVHENSIEAVRKYHDQHEGLSEENENLRSTIFTNFTGFLDNLDTDSYAEYFQVTKTFILYINIFSNQKFNQDVKDLSLRYIKRLIKAYTDKRGRDYQDIKKFVKTTFIDLNFMKPKELVELFKTKRKKKEV
jgi:hypothetical protein